MVWWVAWTFTRVRNIISESAQLRQQERWRRQRRLLLVAETHEADEIERSETGGVSVQAVNGMRALQIRGLPVASAQQHIFEQ